MERDSAIEWFCAKVGILPPADELPPTKKDPTPRTPYYSPYLKQPDDDPDDFTDSKY